MSETLKRWYLLLEPNAICGHGSRSDVCRHCLYEWHLRVAQVALELEPFATGKTKFLS